MFVAPDSFPFSQSILFLLAVHRRRRRLDAWVRWSVLLVSVVLPELLSSLAEYRLLFFGASLLVILWVAPEGVLGTLARLWRADRALGRGSDRVRRRRVSRRRKVRPRTLEVRDIGITFGGIKAASGVSFSAAPGKVTSVIGPNGAGKTTVLNMIGGFYRPDSGSIRLGERELARRSPAWKVARAGIARTYQTTKLFATMSVHRQRADRAAARPARQHGRRMRRRRTIATPPRRCSPSSAITARWRRRRAICRMSIAGWSRSRARWRCVRACCCSTSPPPA